MGLIFLRLQFNNIWNIFCVQEVEQQVAQLLEQSSLNPRLSGLILSSSQLLVVLSVVALQKDTDAPSH